MRSRESKLTKLIHGKVCSRNHFHLRNKGIDQGVGSEEAYLYRNKVQILIYTVSDTHSNEIIYGFMNFK